MSALVGLTPVLRVRLENLFLGRRYPEDGFVEGVGDTGYQGFIAAPEEVFASLSMAELSTVNRDVRLADGTKVKSSVGQGTVMVDGAGVELDGPVETIPGLAEILVGTQLISRFRFELDYCLRRTSITFCR